VRAIDTNVIVRFLVADDPAQTRRVKKLMLDAVEYQGSLFVGISTVLESVWVMQARYGFSSKDILDSFDHLLGMSVLVFESRDVVFRWVRTGLTCGIDIDDYLIGLLNLAGGCTHTLTFDKKAARSPVFSLLD
jgi:predicted nucleic-acid-binding protein